MSKERFRPLTGDLSSLQEKQMGKPKKSCFRPLTGDLSSLLQARLCEALLVPCFRPLTGDLSSLRMVENMKKAELMLVSVPLQGTYLPYPVRATHEFPYASTALCVGKRK